MPKDLMTLAEHFRKSRPTINQVVGNAVKAVSDERAPLSREQAAKISKARRECGMCVGAITAEHFDYKPEVKYLSDVSPRFYEVLGGSKPGSHRLPSHAVVYDYMGGVEKLADILKDGKDFKDWLNVTRLAPAFRHCETVWTDSPEGPAVYCQTLLDIVAKYLKARCGAPADCFSADEWPDGIRPQDVFKTAHRLNFMQ